MEKHLFRTQAIEHKSQRLHGDVLVKPKFSHFIIIGFLGIWLLLISIWALVSEFTLRETVPGWTETTDGIVRVYSKNIGTVTEVLVSDGDTVTKDQPIILIQSNNKLMNGGVLEDRLLSEYQHQSAILDSQLDSSNRIYLQRAANLEKQIDSLELSLKLLEKQSKTQKQIYSITNSQLTRYKALKEEGYVSMLDVDNILSKKLSLENDLQTNMIQRVNLANTIEQLKSEKTLLSESIENEIGNFKILLSDNDQNISKINSQKTHLITASKSGTISNLQVKEGQQVTPSETVPLLSIVPSTNNLVIHLLVPIRSSGFINTGQSLSIRYDAFPFEKFGISTGKITNLSSNTLLPNELLNAPVSIQEPTYRITGKLDKPYVEAYGKKISLKPGMTLNADIALGKRTIFEWLMEPILSLKGRTK